MDLFEKTSLWQESFNGKNYQSEPDALKYLHSSFSNMRNRVEQLVSLIQRDIPSLTVHNITHLDALWETASVIAGPRYPINPAEAFVFGAAVLIHDSAMSLAAYPGGLDELKKTPQWRDALAGRLLAAGGEFISSKDLAGASDDVVKAAVADVLRETHARRAAELPKIKWPSRDNSYEYLIQDTELRNYYGDIIGTIAESHWWPVSDLRGMQDRVNAGPNIPTEWHISPLKIACLLRVADAAHIDHRRAPRFLRTLVQPNGISDIHWAFQEKLGKISIDKNFLVFTGGPFDVREAEAWWLAFDMLSMIDDELRAVHGVLDENGLPPFRATAVKGAKSPTAVAQRIRTKRWQPVSTELRVSDVPSLVQLLGGERLYGSDSAAPIRELIQNAADAIRAKRLLFGDANEDSGKVRVCLRRSADTDWLDFEDSGIGMSQRVLTGALLDFGRSFWQSHAIREEFPGLLSKGLKATGKFGIGFFSVFMLGERVVVTSRRYDAAAAETQTLDFQNGLRVRPILREPSENELLHEPGTRVSVALRAKYDGEGGLLYRGASGSDKVLTSLREIVADVCPSVDVDIEVEENGKKEAAILANDWLNEAPENLIGRFQDSWIPESAKLAFPHMSLLKDGKTGEIHGRACICAENFYLAVGVVTVGGFRACEMQCVAGVLVGEAATVARNSAIPTVPAPVLRDWASEQAQLIAKSKLALKTKLEAASVVMLCGGDASDLPIAILNGEYLTAKQLEEKLVDYSDEVQVYHSNEVEYDEDDYVIERNFKDSFSASETLFFVPQNSPPILTVGAQYWPSCLQDLYIPEQPQTCWEAFHHALRTAWDAEPDSDDDQRVVGYVDGQEIIRSVRVYTRPIDMSQYT